MALCTSCATGSGNTGVPAGAKPYGVTVGLVWVALKAADGTRNEIDCNDTFDQTFLDENINNPDKTKRWYPYINLRNIESVKADNILDTDSSGDSEVVSEGIRNWTGEKWSTTSTELGQTKNLIGCVANGFYEFDECGNFKGDFSEVGKIRPQPISKGSESAVLMLATAGANNQKTILNFNLDKRYRDEDSGYIFASSITADLDLIDGLQDVTLASPVVDAASDTITFSAETLFGAGGTTSLCEKLKVESLLEANITIIVNAIDITATITSFTQVNGDYTIVVSTDIVAAQAYSISFLQNGFEVTTITGVAS